MFVLLGCVELVLFIVSLLLRISMDFCSYQFVGLFQANRIPQVILKLVRLFSQIVTNFSASTQVPLCLIPTVSSTIFSNGQAHTITTLQTDVQNPNALWLSLVILLLMEENVSGQACGWDRGLHP